MRRALGATGFGVGAWTAAAAGDELIESHDETSTGAGAQQELYLVLGGRATFTVGDEEIDAPAGTMRARRGRHAPLRRGRRARHDGARGRRRPGAALPASPFEHYYAAQPAYDAGDYDRAVAIASEGLERLARPGPLIHYQLACFHARAGRLDEARAASLDVAFAGDERTRGWAAEDDDLAALRA